MPDISKVKEALGILEKYISEYDNVGKDDTNEQRKTGLGDTEYHGIEEEEEEPQAYAGEETQGEEDLEDVLSNKRPMKQKRVPKY